jgi:AcrR family transcriptional regulator
VAELLARPGDLRSDAARNRARLLEVARRHHTETGQLPLNAIAAEAGVGIGTAYRHFPSPQALVEALAIGAFEAMLDDVRTAIAVHDPAAALRGMVVAAYEHLCHDSALAAMLTAGSFTCTDVAALAGDLVGEITTVVERAKTAGALRHDITADDLRRLLCGLQAAAAAQPALAEAPARYAEVMVAGLRDP